VDLAPATLAKLRPRAGAVGVSLSGWIRLALEALADGRPVTDEELRRAADVVRADAAPASEKPKRSTRKRKEG
jgi:hypothetical protein